MERQSQTAPSVLIVGAGPAGLFAACELLRHGVTPRIVERRLEPHHETRGTALQPAVLEMIERAGLIEPFLRGGVHVRQVQLLGRGLRELALTKFAGVGCRYEHQCSQPQWQTEAILRAHLASHGIDIEFGTEVLSIEDDADGLHVTLDIGGRTERVSPAYILGAGGAHSITRHSMQEHLDGETYAGRYIVADVKIDLVGPPETARIIVSADGFVLLAPLPDDRWLLFVNRAEADARAELPSEAELGALLDEHIGVAIGLSDLQWVSYFQMYKRVAPRLADGRRFLLGDAAHLSSPLGGEGINAALMDGADIAWKLALVLHGAAKPSLLDSYAVERGAADRHVLEVSDEMHGALMKVVAMIARDSMATLPPADSEQAMAILRRRSMMDVSYAGSAIVGQSGTASQGPAPGERYPERHRLSGTGHHLIVFGDTPPLDPFQARWSQRVTVIDGSAQAFDAMAAGVPPGGGAVLVRPDGFIGFRAAPASDVTLAALDAHLASYLVPQTGRLS